MYKKWILWSTGLLVIGMATLARAAEEDNKDLSGTWIATSVEMDGEESPAEIVDPVRFRFEGKKLFVRGNLHDDQDEECVFSTDDTKDPKHLDIKPPTEEKPVLAIYERKGKTLRICLRHGGSDKGRPTEFKTTPDSELVLIVFKLKEEKKSRDE